MKSLPKNGLLKLLKLQNLVRHQYSITLSHKRGSAHSSLKCSKEYIKDR